MDTKKKVKKVIDQFRKISETDSEFGFILTTHIDQDEKKEMSFNVYNVDSNQLLNHLSKIFEALFTQDDPSDVARVKQVVIRMLLDSNK